MKARLVRDDENHRLILLCNDGTIAKATQTVLFDLLTDFRRDDIDHLFTGSLGRWDTNCVDMAVYPGTTIAFIADDNCLVVYDFSVFKPLLNASVSTRGYISIAEFAERHNKSKEIIKVYCRNGRIPGVKKVARNWLIPENAEYPIDPENRRPGYSGPRPHKRKQKNQSEP